MGIHSVKTKRLRTVRFRRINGQRCSQNPHKLLGSVWRLGYVWCVEEHFQLLAKSPRRSCNLKWLNARRQMGSANDSVRNGVEDAIGEPTDGSGLLKCILGLTPTRYLAESYPILDDGPWVFSNPQWSSGKDRLDCERQMQWLNSDDCQYKACVPICRFAAGKSCANPKQKKIVTFVSLHYCLIFPNFQFS